MHRQAHVEMRIVVLARPGRGIREIRHLDVGMAPLRADECRGIWLASLQFPQHLLCRVSALRRVTPHLPAPSQLLRRIEEDAHAVGIAHLLPVETEQPLDDEEGTWNYILWRPKVTQLVVVARLQDRFSGT